MNAARRKEIDKLLETISSARAELEAVRDAEQEYFDNMPESFQSGEKGQAAEAAVDALDQAIGSMEEVESNLEEAKS